MGLGGAQESYVFDRIQEAPFLAGSRAGTERAGRRPSQTWGKCSGRGGGGGLGWSWAEPLPILLGSGTKPQCHES